MFPIAINCCIHLRRRELGFAVRNVNFMSQNCMLNDLLWHRSSLEGITCKLMKDFRSCSVHGSDQNASGRERG